ncbi:TlpA family protein disulfide reductase [Paraliomyxa miuraensis]|uniref:TlpA family protein disulfide reductase n=1 Tax=Paraliomyxa miuraensis TaxID=376150 RepID=UPI0022586EE6|nr:TlpA disulfide reductase family protein [Paraliomyxa miuraensis]MCX4247831.1 TlpA family protein disulfide reductase [Paraliomyxa miuraensis]
MSPRGSHRLMIALLLAGCASATNEPTEPPAKVHEPGEGVALDDGRIEVAGKLLAHDGTPLRRAELTVRRDGAREPLASVVLGDDGVFRVSIPTGVYSISVAAVDHRMIMRRTVVTHDLRVEGRLGTYARTDPGESLKIRSEYLDGEGKVVGPGPTAAARVADGIHRLELTSKPEGAKRLRYQLASPSGRTYNGPLADDYENDGGGDYWSIVDVSSKEALELDLSALPPAGVSPELRWTGESTATAAVLSFQDRCFESIEGIRNRMPRTDGKLAQMTDELRAETEALAAKARTEIDATTDSSIQALLRAAHLSCFGPLLRRPEDGASLREEVAWVLDHVPPTDPHPQLILNFDNMMYVARREADEAFLAKSDAWLERRAREHSEPSAAIEALSVLLYAADERKDQARVKELHALAMNERFAGTFQQLFIEKEFDPNRVLQRGRPFPAFDFAGLRPTDPHVTSTARSGRLYLVEFWATWCGPCVAEMPNLHGAYAAINGARPGKIAGRGTRKHEGKKKTEARAEADEDAGLRALRPVEHPKVEFVFVSLDANPSDVEAFRTEHWSMPWTHGFVGHSGEKAAMERFGFFGVPTTILVDEKGTIVEYGNALRGENLLPVLERTLAERHGSPARAK